MLIGLDESLYHQAPDPIGMTVTSDHRFFDRYWFSGVRPDGGLAFFAGLGRYQNMGTSDAFFTVVRGTCQYNSRCAVLLDGVPDTSAELRAAVGPQRVTVREPFRRILLELAPGSGPLAAGLEYASTTPAHLEAAHREVRANRVVQQVQRYDQVGRWSGWLEVDGTRYDVQDWWGDRDHSWGVRVDVGGLEPHPLHRRGRSVTVWCNFSTEETVGQFQLREYGDGRPRYVDGRIHWRTPARATDSAAVVDVEHDVEFEEGGTAWGSASFRVTLADGRVLAVAARPLGERAWVSRGGGYSRGFRDGLGFGARRGDVVEHDMFELPDHVRVLLDGRPVEPGHREQLASIVVDGATGTAHLPIMVRSGELPDPVGG